MLRTHFIWEIAINRGFPHSVGCWCSQRVFTFNLRADRTETKVLSPRITLLLTSIWLLIYYHIGLQGLGTIIRNTELTWDCISFRSELVRIFRLVVKKLLIFFTKIATHKTKFTVIDVNETNCHKMCS